jgi:hypothetical protein
VGGGEVGAAEGVVAGGDGKGEQLEFRMAGGWEDVDGSGADGGAGSEDACGGDGEGGGGGREGEEEGAEGGCWGEHGDSFLVGGWCWRGDLAGIAGDNDGAGVGVDADERIIFVRNMQASYTQHTSQNFSSTSRRHIMQPRPTTFHVS